MYKKGTNVLSSLSFFDNMYSFVGYVDRVRSNNVEVTSFRHDNKQICRIPDLPEPVFGHSTIKTQSGVVSCGGEDNSNLATNKCWKLSKNNEWVPFPSMIVKRDDFAMVEGMGQLFSVGGYMDDLSSIEWISIQDGKKWVKQAIPFDIIGHCISKYSRTRFLLTGGYLKSKQQSGSEVKEINLQFASTQNIFHILIFVKLLSKFDSFNSIADNSFNKMV